MDIRFQGHINVKKMFRYIPMYGTANYYYKLIRGSVSNLAEQYSFYVQVVKRPIC